MKNLPNFNVEINRCRGEIYVSDNDGGRYMCVFVKTETADFASTYEAYGFMVFTPHATKAEIEYFPIKLKENTKLTKKIMSEMWGQIQKQIPLP